MKISSFIYRQKQRLKYHLAGKEVYKQIAEINRHRENIEFKKDSYLIKELSLEVPKGKFDFLFLPLCFKILLSNSKFLKGYYEISNDELVFFFDNFRFLITSKSELSIIEEIFIKKCYNFIMPGNRISIIDIGMNVGISSLFFSNHPQVDHIYSFEPFPVTYSLAVRNFSKNKKLSSKISAFNFGLGSKEEELTVKYDGKNKGINSTLITNPRIDTLNMEQIKIKSTYKVISNIINHDPQKNYIIKIDTEGAEYDILKSLFYHGLIKNIKAILLEWHFKGSQEIEEELSKHGFKMISTLSSKNAGLIYAFR